MVMSDLEKVTQGFWCCTHQGNCSICPYDIKGGREYDENGNRCIENLIIAAYEVLKAQEPRVMTWDEVRAAMKAPVWKETKSMHNALYQGWVLAYDIQTGQGITGTRLGMAEPSGRVVWYKAEDYGKTWRCWSAPPTDAQIKAVKWE